MIYITGDIHGDISRLKGKEMRKLKKGDTLIVCGDFGFVWDGSKKEHRCLHWIGRRPYNVLFVDGAHDNLNLLKMYPQVKWQGGKTRELGGNLRFLERGEIFEIEGKKIFAFGGDDGEDELAANSGEEITVPPTMREIEYARNNLRSAGDKVDYIITHRPSRKIRQFLVMTQNTANILDAFLDEVREKCEYSRWFFGSIHRDKRIPPNEMALFTAVVDAGGEL